MKAGPIEIGRLLQTRQRFCVPIYQRHYVWTKQKQWEPFWNDVRTKAIECLSKRERRFSHFMGAVVLEARGGFSARRVPSFQVVDGQQRLTTFQLFLAAARDYALESGLETSADRIASYLINEKQHLMESPEVEMYKVWPTQYDRTLFMDIVGGTRAKLRAKYSTHYYAKRDKLYEYNTVPKLLAAYGYFFERIKHAVETDDLDDEFWQAPETDQEIPDDLLHEADAALREMKLDSIWSALVDEFKVVEITLEEGDDAQVIFETLNERGEALLAADLVRNNIFQRADAGGEKAEKLFARYWKEFEDPFWNFEEKQGRYKKPRIEFFLSNYIAGQISGEINLSKLFSEYKNFNKKRAFEDVEHELRELERYGLIYRELLERKSDTPLAQFSLKLHPWDVTTVYPLVLRLWADGGMSEGEKARCFDLLLAYIVRRAICGLTNKNYNKSFLAIISHLESKGWSFANLSTYLLSQKADTTRFPPNEEFETAWISSPAYSVLQPIRTRAVLEQLELAKRTKFHETNKLATALTVEHVMPREWSKHWPLPDGSQPNSSQLFSALYSSDLEDPVIGQIIKRNRALDTFGNLTLLTKPFNSSLSHSSFEKKREALEKQSLLVVNKEICRHSTWDEKAISKRSHAMFQIAREIWPMPV